MKKIPVITVISFLGVMSCSKINDRVEEEKAKLLKETEKLKVQIDSGLKKVDSLKMNIDSFTQKIITDSIRTDTNSKK